MLVPQSLGALLGLSEGAAAVLLTMRFAPEVGRGAFVCVCPTVYGSRNHQHGAADGGALILSAVFKVSCVGCPTVHLAPMLSRRGINRI